MKIRDAVTQNKEYWEQEKARLERQIASHQKEIEKLAKEHTEAFNQIELYNKADELLKTLEPKEVDEVKVVK